MQMQCSYMQIQCSNVYMRVSFSDHGTDLAPAPQHLQLRCLAHTMNSLHPQSTKRNTCKQLQIMHAKSLGVQTPALLYVCMRQVLTYILFTDIKCTFLLKLFYVSADQAQTCEHIP